MFGNVVIHSLHSGEKILQLMVTRTLNEPRSSQWKNLQHVNNTIWGLHYVFVEKDAEQSNMHANAAAMWFITRYFFCMIIFLKCHQNAPPTDYAALM